MSVIIKSTEMNYKDPDSGEYIGVNVVAEKKTSEQLADIQATGTQQISLIAAKGAETLESIPEDYTFISRNVVGIDETIELITNLADPAKVVNGSVWTSPTSTYNSSGYSRTIVRVKPSTKYTINGVNVSFSWFTNDDDENLGAISGMSYGGIIETPVGCTILKISRGEENYKYIVLEGERQDYIKNESCTYGEYYSKRLDNIDGKFSNLSIEIVSTSSSATLVRNYSTLFKNRPYIFENTGESYVQMTLTDSSGSETLLLEYAPPGYIYSFVPDKDYVKISCYFFAAGSVEINSDDFYGIVNSKVSYENFYKTLDIQEVTIERDDAGTSSRFYTFFKGRKYRYSNTSDNSTAINLSLIDSSGTSTSILSSLSPGESATFICNGNDYVKFSSYFSGAGSSQLEPVDDGIFYTLNELKDEIAIKATYDYVSLALFEKIAVIGDSYSSGAIYNNEGETIFSGHTGRHNGMSWLKILARKNGVEGTLYSSPGNNTNDWLTSTDGYGLAAMLADTPKNLYFIMLGINTEPTLGSISDCHVDWTQNANSFYGNYGKIIGNVQNHAPNAKIICIVPPITPSNRQQAIYDVADFYDVPVINTGNDSYFASSFYKDNKHLGHPIGITYSGMALAYERLASLCIQNNVEYFTTYWGND